LHWPCAVRKTTAARDGGLAGSDWFEAFLAFVCRSSLPSDGVRPMFGGVPDALSPGKFGIDWCPLVREKILKQRKADELEFVGRKLKRKLWAAADS